MEISQEQWDKLVNQVNGFQAQIEELKTENTNLAAKNGEYETKLQEWQTKLNDQQKTIDTLATAQGKKQEETKPKSSGHKTVRFDPVQDKYVFE